MHKTTINPDISELEEVLKSYGHPELRVPFHSLYYKDEPPWTVHVVLLFTDQIDVDLTTPNEWRKRIIDRIEVLFKELRKVGWVRVEALSLNFTVEYDQPTCTLDNKLVHLGGEYMNTASAEFQLVPISGELVDE